jgi:tetratricopeptide (TPR) repeat protein
MADHSPAEQRLVEAGRRLLEQMSQFGTDTQRGLKTQDDHLIRGAIRKFQKEVQRAAEVGCELSLAWHVLGEWTLDYQERIAIFSREWTVLMAENEWNPPTTPGDRWIDEYAKGVCLYEIAESHFALRQYDEALKFLEQAQPHAEYVARLRGQHEPLEREDEEKLEDRVTALREKTSAKIALRSRIDPNH